MNLQYGTIQLYENSPTDPFETKSEEVCRFVGAAPSTVEATDTDTRLLRVLVGYHGMATFLPMLGLCLAT